MKKYTAAEHMAYGSIAAGLGLAVVATFIAFAKADAIACVFAAFGWIAFGWAAAKE